MSESKTFAKGDYVVATGSPNGPDGIVRRVAKDGSWADVWFDAGFDSWSKRIKTEYLRVRVKYNAQRFTK